MSDSVYSYNLLPNPKPTDTSAWKFCSQKDLRVQMLSDNRLHITNNANIADSYIYTQLQLPAGTYRFGAEVSAPAGRVCVESAACGHHATHRAHTGHMGRQSAGIDLQHGCRFIRTAPVGAHAHERNGRDHAIQTPLGHGLEPLVSGLTLVPGLGVAA